jgi:hypothetical protein
MFNDFAHDRTKTRDGAWSEMVSVAETTGKDDDIGALEVVLLMPQTNGLRA